MSVQRNYFQICVVKLAQIVLIIAAAMVFQINVSAQAQTLTEELEKQCFDMVQGKVAYDRAGNKAWAPANIRRLCAGTLGPAQTVKCFENVIRTADNWEMGIGQCSRKPDTTVGQPFPGPKMPVPTPTPTPGPTGLSTPPTGVQFLPEDASDTAGPMEKACHEELKWKVEIVKGGSKDWSEQAYRALCKGTTTSPAPAVACYKRSIAEVKGPQRSIEQCAVIPPPAGRIIDFTVLDVDAGKGDPESGLTPDDLDPVEIEINPPPLSDDDMSKVMKWIGVRTSALITPYCYRASYSLVGQGSTLSCPAGKEKNGQLCYDSCRADYTGNGPVCYQNCPAGSGLKDIGALCQKPASYGRGGGYALWDKAKCDKDSPQGCEQNGALFYPKCKDGFEAVGCCVCSPKCPLGMTNTGTDCVKNSYGRGVGSPISGCPPGKQQTGLLCFEPCKDGYAAHGSTCYQKCPVQQSVDCAAGCAATGLECGTVTATQVIAPIILVYSLATLGGGSGQSALARYAASTGRGLASAVKTTSAVGRAGSRLVKSYNSVKRGLQAALGPAGSKTLKQKVADWFGGQEKFDDYIKGLKMINQTRAVISGTYRLVTTYSREYANNFEELTSHEIAQEIDSRFGKVGAREIKKRWALYNLHLIDKAQSEATAQVVLSVISTFDPTGITGVVSAFFHPICGDTTPFPAVTPLYKR